MRTRRSWFKAHRNANLWSPENSHIIISTSLIIQYNNNPRAQTLPSIEEFETITQLSLVLCCLAATTRLGVIPSNGNDDILCATDTWSTVSSWNTPYLLSAIDLYFICKRNKWKLYIASYIDHLIILAFWYYIDTHPKVRRLYRLGHPSSWLMEEFPLVLIIGYKWNTRD